MRLQYLFIFCNIVQMLFFIYFKSFVQNCTIISANASIFGVYSLTEFFTQLQEEDCKTFFLKLKPTLYSTVFRFVKKSLERVGEKNSAKEFLR